MDSALIEKLKEAVETLKEKPELFESADLKFFRDYIESLGGSVPMGGTRATPEAGTPMDTDKDTADPTSTRDVPKAETTDKPMEQDEEPEDEEEQEEEELDELEGIDDPEVLKEPDNDPPQEMGDPNVEASEEDIERQVA